MQVYGTILAGTPTVAHLLLQASAAVKGEATLSFRGCYQLKIIRWYEVRSRATAQVAASFGYGPRGQVCGMYRTSRAGLRSRPLSHPHVRQAPGYQQVA